MRLPARLERRNALFQQWQSLLTNRTKRTRTGEMIVHGVRPITQAIAHGHEIRALLSDGRLEQSRWARELLQDPPAPVVEVASELMAELGQRDDGPPELLAIAAVPADDLGRLDARLSGEGGGHVRGSGNGTGTGLVVAFDRPTSPGNIGSLARSVDALGGHGLVITGRSADAWDPAAIRASTGSVFAVPVVRLDSHRDLWSWVEGRRGAGEPWQVVGLEEARGHELADTDLTVPTVLVVGNETIGLSAGWRESCDQLAEIPMTGSASSLNAAVAGSIALYEVARQRGPSGS
ncbi:RNA methyltransferase [Brachybacterium sp. p3-SID957]|uniref:RNA methyltransferase n=1 Tax=Brachybacterium sp. p3-SID957 TaxID=2916049 RepID=UPI00223ACA54|nr:RNA methyltransferase [Brachybacterium sp. p3-SID957]MCT1775373.1 RNA methyltransferase [Brachybacterium sp. p3-SID957]